MARETGVITVNLSAIAANWRMLCQALTNDAQCGAVVKANAYGLGVAQVAQTLFAAGCRNYFVAHAKEAVELRRILPANTTIYVLQGCRAGDEPLFVEYQLIPVLVSLPMLERWSKFAAGRAECSSVLKINTGMNRLGLALDEFYALIESNTLQQASVTMLLSHLACADEPQHPLNQIQLQRFNEAYQTLQNKLPTLKGSLANSAGVFLGEQWHFHLARTGIALYGGYPRLDSSVAPTPVVSVKAPVIQTRRLEAGEAVGYGAEFRAPKAMHIAVVSCGYADGFLRSLKGHYHAWYQQYLPLLGRVSMDSLIFDITHLSTSQKPNEGAEIELLGEHVGLADFAASAGTSAYEVLTGLGGRMSTRFVETGA